MHKIMALLTSCRFHNFTNTEEAAASVALNAGTGA